MKYLLDTNVLSEVRKAERADGGVRRWFESVPDDALFVSVLVLGEIRRGVELKRRKDPRAAQHLEAWLEQLTRDFGERLLPVDARVADAWGRMQGTRPLPAIDGLLAATAQANRLTLVTRNTDDFAALRIQVLNPFSQ